MEYLNKDMVHQTHHHIWWLKVQKPVIALSKLDQLEVDLINMSKWARSNNRRRYALNIIDCFSKYAWLLLITQKKTEKVLEVLWQELTPKVLQSDNSGKFTNVCMEELLDNLHINILPASHISPAAMGKLSAVIEQ